MKILTDIIVNEIIQIQLFVYIKMGGEMKKILVLIALGAINFVDACPTCYGKLQKNAPAFFADEFEKAEEADNQDTDASEKENDHA